MTLREEIHEYVYQHNKYEYGKCEECEYRTDQIIKLFEKLIDEKIDECRKEKFAEADEAIGILEELREELKK